MASLSNVLASIPGYGAYVAKRELNEQAGQEDIRQAGALQAIYASIQQQNLQRQQEARTQESLAREALVRQKIAALPPDQRTRENVLPILLEQAGSPKDIAAMLPAGKEFQSVGAGGLYDVAAGKVIPPAAKPGDEWTPPYLLNGAQVQRNLTTGQIRSVVSREPMGAQDRPFYQPVQTAEGVRAFNARTGQIEQPKSNVVGAANDPALQQRLAAGKAAGKEYGEEGAKATLALPRVEDTAAQQSALIDKMIGSKDGKVKAHPGFQGYIGITLRPGAAAVEGSKEADFKALLEQSMGGAFLQAFESLKGGGQITEVEGQKATAAITRMRKAQSEAAFIEAARDYQDVINKALQRARLRATVGPKPDGTPASPSAPSGPQEGTTATNKATGQRIIFRNGQWQPM